MLALGYNEYINLLKAIPADEGNHGEKQNEAKGLDKRLSSNSFSRQGLHYKEKESI